MKSKKFTKRIFLLSFVSVLALLGTGCGLVDGTFESMTKLVGISETGTVIVYRAQVRSSYAVVAADLLEVKRGDKMDILEETDFEKVKWYRVRMHDEDSTEGWLEAQNVITGSLLEKSQKLAEEDVGLQSQAMGRLRAPTNLRLSPEQKDDNVLYKLEKKSDNQTTFEIISWKYTPRIQGPTEADSKGQALPKTKNEEIEAAKEADKPEDLDEKYDIWYKVRLSPSVSPAPAGWIFGRQVELQVPSDILIYQLGSRKFITWRRIDNVEDNEKDTGKDAVKISKPGSWVVLMRSNEVKERNGVEPDFDGILVLAYDKVSQEHYTIYRNEVDVWGKVPLKVEGAGDSRTFTVQVMNSAGQMEEKKFSVIKEHNRLKCNPPPDLPDKRRG